MKKKYIQGLGWWWVWYTDGMECLWGPVSALELTPTKEEKENGTKTS